MSVGGAGNSAGATAAARRSRVPTHSAGGVAAQARPDLAEERQGRPGEAAVDLHPPEVAGGHQKSALAISRDGCGC